MLDLLFIMALRFSTVIGFVLIFFRLSFLLVYYCSYKIYFYKCNYLRTTFVVVANSVNIAYRLYFCYHQSYLIVYLHVYEFLKS